MVSKCEFSVWQSECFVLQILGALPVLWGLVGHKCKSLNEISFSLSFLQIRRRNLCCFGCMLGKLGFIKEKVLFSFCLRLWRWKYNECIWKWAKSLRYFWSSGISRWNFSPVQLGGDSGGSGFMRKRDQVDLIGPCPQSCVCGTWRWQSLTFVE